MRFSIVQTESEKDVLERRLERLRTMRNDTTVKHESDASKLKTLTYYDGHRIGMLDGKISILEEMLEEINER